jgi:hypothetical protein
MKYYIYHIPGIKIGCSKTPKQRVKGQGYSNFEILEEHIDIYIASNREIELQKQYGYPVDKTSYWQTVSAATLEDRKRSGRLGGCKIGKTNGINLVNSGEWKKRQSNGGKIQGSIPHICPYCSKKGTGNTMKRWHFDNCKKNLMTVD